MPIHLFKQEIWGLIWKHTVVVIYCLKYLVHNCKKNSVAFITTWAWLSCDDQGKLFQHKSHSIGWISIQGHCTSVHWMSFSHAEFVCGAILCLCGGCAACQWRSRGTVGTGRAIQLVEGKHCFLPLMMIMMVTDIPHPLLMSWAVSTHCACCDDDDHDDYDGDDEDDGDEYDDDDGDTHPLLIAILLMCWAPILCVRWWWW